MVEKITNKNYPNFILFELIQYNECDTDNYARIHKRRNNHEPNKGKSISRQQTLQLSSSLKQLSNQKHLNQASLKLYNHSSNDSFRDSHHGSIMIDCCSRCSDENEKDMKKQQIAIQAYTALLKGYAHSGQMDKGSRLYQLMWKFKSKSPLL